MQRWFSYMTLSYGSRESVCEKNAHTVQLNVPLSHIDSPAGSRLSSTIVSGMRGEILAFCQLVVGNSGMQARAGWCSFVPAFRAGNEIIELFQSATDG